MLVVAAVGGNALIRRGEPLSQSVQERNVGLAARSLARIALQHRLVVTHGNGPQVGLLALAQEASAGTSGAQPYGLDVLGSETQGMIGYLLEEALREALPGREVATLLTQVQVDRTDPAFATPSKPIGPVYEEAEARGLASRRGWTIARDGAGFRRVVPSPEPRRIVELGAIRLLVEHEVLVICAGGGGVPVVIEGGAYYGVEGVVDKDLTAALLAGGLGADALLLLTDVGAVELGWGTRDAQRIREASAAAMRAQSFATGTMGPKVEAACRFAEATGRRAVIGALEAAPALLAGTAGTSIVPGTSPLALWDVTQ